MNRALGGIATCIAGAAAADSVEVAVRPDGAVVACSIDGRPTDVPDCVGRKARFAVPTRSGSASPATIREDVVRLDFPSDDFGPDSSLGCRLAMVPLPSRGEAKLPRAAPAEATAREVERALGMSDGTLKESAAVDLDGDGEPETVFFYDNFARALSGWDPMRSSRRPVYQIGGVLGKGGVFLFYLNQDMFDGGDAIPEIELGGFTQFPADSPSLRLITYRSWVGSRETSLWSFDAEGIRLIERIDTECL